MCPLGRSNYKHIHQTSCKTRSRPILTCRRSRRRDVTVEGYMKPPLSWGGFIPSGTKGLRPVHDLVHTKRCCCILVLQSAGVRSSYRVRFPSPVRAFRLHITAAAAIITTKLPIRRLDTVAAACAAARSSSSLTCTELCFVTCLVTFRMDTILACRPAAGVAGCKVIGTPVALQQASNSLLGSWQIASVV